MGLRIVYGRAGCGKSHFCLEEIKSRVKAADLQSNHKKLVLIVPEQFSLQAEIKLVKGIGASGINQAEVLSFRRMAYRAFNQTGGLARRHIQAAGRCMLLYRIMEDMKDRLKVFGRAAARKGFVNTLSTTVSELKRYNIAPRMIEELLDRDGLDASLVDKMSDIGMIYGEYENRLHERYIEADDDLTLLAEKLGTCDLYDGAEIWIDEFSGFTPQEYSVIETLLKKAERVTVTLCADCLVDDCNLDGTELFSPTQAAAAKLMALANGQQVLREPAVALDGNDCGRLHWEDLCHLERNLFAFSASIYKGEARHVHVLAAANPYSEIEHAAAEIVRLCRDEGLRYSQIAVVTGDLAAYEKIIEEIFKAYGIPSFIDRKRSVSGHPLVLLVLSVLQIFIGRWSYESIFRYLKTGLTDVDYEDIDLIENYVLANGIRGLQWTKEEDWQFRPDYGSWAEGPTEYQSLVMERINETRRKIIQPLMEFQQATKGSKTGREYCKAMYDLLCAVGVPGRIETMVQGFKEAGELNLANEYSQIWNIVMTVLDQVVDIMAGDSMTQEKFQEILTVGFAEYNMGLIPPALEQVLVGSVERSKNHDIKALFIIGVNDGTFPAMSKDEGILSDRDREGLKALGMEIAQDTRSRTFEQQFMVYRTLTAAMDEVYMSYAIADNEGKAMRPSTVISRLRRIFPGLAVQSSLLQELSGEGEMPMEAVASPLPTFDKMVGAIKRRMEGRETGQRWQEVLLWYGADQVWKEKCQRIFSGFGYSNQVSRISPEKVRQLYGRQVHTSVSRLERFAACPFAYFTEYGLKARERKVFQLSAPDLGSFLHEVLDAFSRYVHENGISWRSLEEEWCREKVSEIVDQLLSGMQGSILNSSRRYLYISGRLKRVLGRAVWIIAQHIQRSGFEPLGYEMDFGLDGQLPPITIVLSSGEEIILNGRIDRIDSMEGEDGTYVRIIDYKSGNKDFKLQDIYYGLQIQLITYLDALASGGLKGKGPVLPAGMLYFRIDDPYISGNRELTEEQIKKEIMKKLKMRGLLLADARLIKEMDREIEGDSLIIPARINADGNLGRASAATREQFGYLQKHVRRLLSQLGQEMLRGNIRINPYKNKNRTPCQFCSYGSVCQFDPSFRDNTYRVLSDKKDSQIWEDLCRGGDENGMDA